MHKIVGNPSACPLGEENPIACYWSMVEDGVSMHPAWCKKCQCIVLSNKDSFFEAFPGKLAAHMASFPEANWEK